jgi:hypothetical protein
MTGDSIPESLLLPSSSEIAQTNRFGTLTAYSFITGRWRQQEGQQARKQQEETFDAYRLVHLATRNWLRAHGQWRVWADKALMRLVDVVPFGGREKRDVWTAYLPHAIHITTLPGLSRAKEKISLLRRIGSCQLTLGHYKSLEGTAR